VSRSVWEALKIRIGKGGDWNGNLEVLKTGESPTGGGGRRLLNTK
jgi:hypothetical protein